MPTPTAAPGPPAWPAAGPTAAPAPDPGTAARPPRLGGEFGGADASGGYGNWGAAGPLGGSPGAPPAGGAGGFPAGPGAGFASGGAGFPPGGGSGFGDSGTYGAPYQPLSPTPYGPIGFAGDTGRIDRPGSVTTALALAIVFGAIGAGLGGLMLLGGAVFSSASRRLGEGTAQDEAWGDIVGAVGIGITLVGVLLLLWCITEVVLAIVALGPRNGARIGVIVLTAAMAVFQFLSTARSLIDGDTFSAVVGLSLTIALAIPPALLLGRDANLYYSQRR